jgi:hypothetical protein
MVRREVAIRHADLMRIREGTTAAKRDQADIRDPD